MPSIHIHLQVAFNSSPARVGLRGWAGYYVATRNRRPHQFRTQSAWFNMLLQTCVSEVTSPEQAVTSADRTDVQLILP